MASSERVSWVYREQSKRDSVVIIRQLFHEGRQDFPSLSLAESVISAFGWLLFYPGSCWADKCPVSTFHVVSSSPAAPISSPSSFPLSEGSWGTMGELLGPWGGTATARGRWTGWCQLRRGRCGNSCHLWDTGSRTNLCSKPGCHMALEPPGLL